MRNLFIILGLVFLASTIANAQEYTANTWASWAKVTSQVDWVFPYSSRSVVLMNGASNATVCVSFGRSATIGPDCTDSKNDVFQLGTNQFIVIENLVRPEIHMRSANGVAASPVSVLVTY